jgi:hypothetical protein
MMMKKIQGQQPAVVQMKDDILAEKVLVLKEVVKKVQE